MHTPSHLNVSNDHGVAVTVKHVLPLGVSIDDHWLAPLSVGEGTEDALCIENTTVI